MKKILLSIAAGLILSTGLFAQITGTNYPANMVDKGAAPEDKDYVTIGSIMPYQVTPYNWGSLSSVVTSNFNWNVTSGAGAIKKTDGSGSDLTNTYSTNNVVGIAWPTAGDYTITVLEKGVMAGFSESCISSGSSITVTVLNRPTASVSGTIVTCLPDLGTSVAIPVDLTGSKNWTVNYTVTYTALDNSTSTIDLAGSSISAPASAAVAHTAGSYGEDYAGSLGNLTIGAAKFGKYVITLNGISDKISTKSGVAAVAGDYTGTYTVYALPTPTTNPVQHLKNN